MENKIVLALNSEKDNPRNSEGAFITLPDGRILFAYTRFAGNNWNDDARADIAARYSEDGGDTWSDTDRILVRNEGQCNVMSVSLLRLQDRFLRLFYLRKNHAQDCRPYMRKMKENGEIGDETVLCIPDPGYFVVNNDRIIQLTNGRLIIPAAFHRAVGKQFQEEPDISHEIDIRGIAMFYLSDDQGKSWRAAKDWWAFPGKCASGLQEPGVMELKDGRIFAWCRTDAGCQYELFSEDYGETWSAPQPAWFKSPCSPLSIKRIPSTGDLLAIWNDSSLVRERGLEPPQESSWGRTPLVSAISTDEGKTWSASKIIESDPSHGYCYTAIHFAGDSVLLAYCCGGGKTAVLQDLCIRKISMDWLYSSGN